MSAFELPLLGGFTGLVILIVLAYAFYYGSRWLERRGPRQRGQQERVIRQEGEATRREISRIIDEGNRELVDEWMRHKGL